MIVFEISLYLARKFIMVIIIIRINNLIIKAGKIVSNIKQHLQCFLFWRHGILTSRRLGLGLLLEPL